MNIVLVSTYDLGHQPFGLASPQAWLLREGHQVACADLSLDTLPDSIHDADLVGFYLPMHTATRLALPVIEKVRLWNERALLFAYGLYAPLNAEHLRRLGIQAIIGGEFEPALAALARGDVLPQASGEIHMDRLEFLTPDRTCLPGGERYAHIRLGGESRQVAYTEASRGCKHLCRHCPIVPVYKGQFRIVQRDVVLEDIRQQVAAGARHVTFGDPDFFNGPLHAIRIVEQLHREFPAITYDATIKIEHILKHRDLLPVLRDTGCVFITSAAESVDDGILEKLEKRHTRRDFFEAVSLTRVLGLALQPTFIPFTPWTSLAAYRDLLHVVSDLELVESVGPVQLGLRLLITPESRLLDLEEVRSLAGPFDARQLVHPWAHPDPQMDLLARQVLDLVSRLQAQGCGRSEIFRRIWELAGDDPLPPENFRLLPRATVPYLEQPWYC